MASCQQINKMLIYINQINFIQQFESKQKLLQYSIFRKVIMSKIFDYFEEIINHQPLGQTISLKIQIPHTFNIYEFTASMHKKTQVVFVDKITLKTFSLRACNKMEPKYDVSNSNSSQLVQILIHCSDQFVKIRSADQNSLTKLYEKLKMVISHKGFNEYFKPIKRLGRGAFATVYLIEHKLTKLQYAAKVFSREGQKLEFKGHQALQNEIRTLRQLSHPNIIKYQGIYQTQNLIYLVTEYLSGGNLQDFMKKKCNLKGNQISQIISDSLEALIYLRKNNIMHRDLKPQNILFRQKDRKWVLIDFGLAAFINQTYLYDKCGTMGYMAPQVLAQKQLENQKIKSYSLQCDLYSLGVISYQLIIGSLPFKVQSQGMFEKKIVWNAFNREECSNIHPQIVQFLKGLLEKDPLKRLTAQQSLSSSFFIKQQVIQSWAVLSQKRIDERYDKILKLANCN